MTPTSGAALKRRIQTLSREIEETADVLDRLDLIQERIDIRELLARVDENVGVNA